MDNLFKNTKEEKDKSIKELTFVPKINKTYEFKDKERIEKKFTERMEKD